MTAFTDALAAAPPAGCTALYWLARLTLVNRQQDMALFDAGLRGGRSATRCSPVDPHARRQDVARRRQADGRRLAPVRRRPPRRRPDGAALPWHTLPRTVDGRRGRGRPRRLLPELLPSAVARIADTPLDELDDGRAGGARPLARGGRATAGRPAAAGASAVRADGAPGRAAGDDRRLPAYRLGADGAPALPTRCAAR